ncbi:hypothetical protein B566_EDAN009685 [Ephemera danica]|nr:hypothetical protein B566_EDAN009685 [Ephemera danica]
MPTAVKIPNIKLNNGYEIPIFGLGTWKSEPQEVVQVVKDAIDLGYRHFDCAFLYENEQEVGEGIKAKIEEGVVKREDLFITSKLWNTFQRPDLVVEACGMSVKNLGEDGDLMPKDSNDKVQYSNVDYVDTWVEMEKCVELGLTRSIGLSNFNSQQTLRILDKAKIKPSHDIAVTAYGPLGSPYRPLPKPDDIPLLEEPKLKAIAAHHTKSVQRGNVTIPKSVHKARILENFSIFDFELSADDMSVIDSFDCNGRLIVPANVEDHPHFPFAIEF